VKQVYIAADPVEAHLLKAVLGSEGIGAVVQGEQLFSLRSGVPVTPETRPSVWIVEDGVLESAAAVVEALVRRKNIG
jgi:hypothetical protein